MKQILSLLCLCISASIVLAGSSIKVNKNDIPGNQLTSNFTIDMYDTVVFDISQATMAGNQVSFPVYILSDDSINALDFSMGYDQSNFSLDSIIDLTTYLEPVYNFTMNTLYFTSYSLQTIDNNSPLLTMRFNMLGHYLCSDDLDSILVYLNGDPCSVKVVECLSDKISEAENEGNDISVYPNPVSGMLNIKSDENVSVELLNINASQVHLKASANAGQLLQLNTTGIAKGIYLVKLFNDNFISIKKVIIN